jgi:hypothetical protein
MSKQNGLDWQIYTEKCFAKRAVREVEISVIAAAMNQYWTCRHTLGVALCDACSRLVDAREKLRELEGVES